MRFGPTPRMVVSFVVALALGSIAAAEASDHVVVRGVLVRSPVTPVCVEGRSCSAPAVRTTVVFLRRGREAARSVTDDRGRFSLLLAPGTYRVHVPRRTSLGSVTPAVVQIAVARTAWLRLELDSGIRRPGASPGS